MTSQSQVLTVHDNKSTLNEQVPGLFDQADNLLFKSRKFSEAEAIYRQILELEPRNTHAINSIAYCVKFTAASTAQGFPENLFETLHGLY